MAMEDPTKISTNDELRQQLEQSFRSVAGSKAEVSVETFSKSFGGGLGFSKRVIEYFDVDGNGFVSWDEFLNGLTALSQSDWREQAEFQFWCMDTDGSAELSSAELVAALRANLSRSGLKLAPATIEKLTKTMVSALDASGDGAVSVEELLSALEGHPHLRQAFEFSPLAFIAGVKSHGSGGNSGSGRDAASGGGSGEGKKDGHGGARGGDGAGKGKSATGMLGALASATATLTGHIKAQTTFSSTEQRIAAVWYVLYLGAMAALTANACIEYGNKGASMTVQAARSGGANLNLHGFLLLATMLRKTHTVIGALSPSLSALLCLDFTVAIHRTIGRWNAFWTIVHLVAHCTNYVASWGNNGAVDYIFTTSRNQGWVAGAAGVTGVALTAILMVIIAGYVLRDSDGWAGKLTGKLGCSSKRFELFQLSHRLAYVYPAIMVIHAPSCWKWLCGPLALLGLELVLRYLACASPITPSSAVLLPQGVLELTLPKPKSFPLTSACGHPSGSYAFLCVPSVSGHEWHPFTISSSGDVKAVGLLHGLTGTTTGPAAVTDGATAAADGPLSIRPNCGTISFHIRAAGKGTWTGKLRGLIEARDSAAKKERKATAGSSGSLLGSTSSRRGLAADGNGAGGATAITIAPDIKGHSTSQADPTAATGSSMLAENPSNVLTPSNASEPSPAVVAPAPAAGPVSAANKRRVAGQLQSGQLHGLHVLIDGPYYAPSMHVLSSPHAIFVAGGIGVTPFAAVLEHLVAVSKAHRLRQAALAAIGQGSCDVIEWGGARTSATVAPSPTASSPSSATSPRGISPSSNGSPSTTHTSGARGEDHINPFYPLRRLDFMWLNNDLDCTSWLTPLLTAAQEEKDKNPTGPLAKLLHVHIYLTSLPRGDKMDETALLHLAADALGSRGLDAHDKGAHGNDIAAHPLTGLKSRVHTGRPDWPATLERLRGRSPAPGQMRLFFCGPPALGTDVQQACVEKRVNFREEVFN